MKLTPLEIRKQDFTRTFRGYDEDEVQAFLQMVSEQWDEMVDLQRRLELRVQDLENKVRHYERVEEALHEALQTARQNAKQIVEGAQSEARQHVQEAEAQGRALVREAEQQRDRLRQEAQGLLERRAAIASHLRALLNSELEMLARFSEEPLPSLDADRPPPMASARPVVLPEPTTAKPAPPAVDAEPEKRPDDEQEEALPPVAAIPALAEAVPGEPEEEASGAQEPAPETLSASKEEIERIRQILRDLD